MVRPPRRKEVCLVRKPHVLVSVVLGTLLVALLGVGTAAANGGPQTSASACGGKLVINVTFKSINNYDSGVNGNAWANDSIGRHVQVWQTGDDTFCVVTSNQGSFVTFAGDSPNGVVDGLSAGVNGTINGGYRGAITGTLASSPAYSAKGNLGTFDYACTDAYTCPGAFSWLDTYFSSWDFSYDWWGWQYRTAKNGTWVNSSDGNSGDIAG